MKEKVGNSIVSLCRECTQNATEKWEGWPPKPFWPVSKKKDTEIPRLHIVNNDICDQCGSSELISSDQVVYRNIHYPGNSGLPDIFKMLILEREHPDYEFCTKWSLPYTFKQNLQ